MISFTGIVGSDFWLDNYEVFGYSYPLRTYATYIFFLVSTLFIANNIINVFNFNRSLIYESLTNTLTFFFMILSLLVFANFTDSWIAAKYPKVVLYVYGFSFANHAAHIQLAHLCKSSFPKNIKTVFMTPLILLIITIFK